MKTFKRYLAESVRSYKYKIRIAGEPQKNFLELFTYNLAKFDPVHISTPKSTPVQSKPLNFPELKDQSVTMIDVEFRYPATEQMIKQLATLLQYDENLVRMLGAEYMDSLEAEESMYENQPNPLIGDDTLEDNGKEASKEYGDSYLTRIRAQEKGKAIKQEFAKKEGTQSADPFNPSKLIDKQNQSSPMSKIKRPALPATGARK
jgi:hypothetical protein